MIPTALVLALAAGPLTSAGPPAVAPVPVQDQGAVETPGFEAPRVRAGTLPAGIEPPTIDGILNDDAWDAATLLGPLKQVVPVAGAEPSERTEVRLLADRTAIYLAIRCFDDDPQDIRATQMKRDANLDPDDRVEFWFDTFLDRRNAFWFQIGAAGSRGDALIAKNGSRFNKDFDTIWYGRARVTPEGWMAEVEIPAASVNFDPLADTWGFNLRRHIRRRSEVARWSAPDPKYSFFSIAQGGTLEGVGGMHQGLGLDVKPFGVADWIDPGGVGDDIDREFDAGLDAFYKLTPSSKVSVSFNTDFAETEVDERRINLTRFALFFPEKRDFFLEDSSYFVFGAGGRGGSGDVLPFFSRRIGLDANRAEVPLLGSVKLTGATERFSFGLIDVQADETAAVASQNLFAGRFSYNILEQSDVGLITTVGDPEDAGRNATYGADLNLRTNTFLGDRNLRFSSYVLRTDSDTNSTDDLAYFAQVQYPNDQIQLTADVTVVEPNFDPALGFVRRGDMKKYSSRLQWRPRMYSWIRTLDFQLRPTLITDTGNNTETVDVLVRPFGMVTEADDRIRVDFLHRREVLEEDFNIQDAVVIPQGAHTFQRGGVAVETSERRDVSVEASYFLGQFFDGHSRDVSVELGWRPDPHTVFSGEYERNDADLPGGRFRVQTGRLRADLLFTPEISWSNYLQYDNVSNDLGLNSRLRWILEPGRELNLVFNQGWEWSAPNFAPTSSQATAKLSYTIRL